MTYITTLLLMLSAYGFAVYMMKYMRNTLLTNAVLIALVYIPYVWHVLIVYFDVGFYDWNFQNTLPTANVSPFTFSLVPIILLLRGRAREYASLLVSLLSVGMLASSVFGCVYNAVIGYRLHFHFILNYLSHFAISLLGVYLVRTGQVRPRVKESILSSSIIVGAAFFMMVLNLVLDTSYFGLSLTGKHNIYNMVLTDSSALSACLYFVGLIAVLAMGYALSRILESKLYITREEQ